MEHTKVPWKASYERRIYEVDIHNAKGDVIIRVEYLGDVKQTEAIAAYIVRACNAFPAMEKACKDIEDGPDSNCAEIHLTDNYQQGLFCGLEDRDITDRYDACMYGFEKAVERVTEWAQGMVEAAIAAAGGE